ncbi:MAG: cyclic nucleotide-binding domain-containing protein [Bacteriovorax sp.]|nr:cyclic nucleotide-binding domain-containing protein [Bacteriovorax sp.]
MEDGTQTIALKKDDILFLAEEKDNDLYIVQKGKVMVFVQKGSEIIPVAYLGKGEYIGELSFFDNDARSASIICLEDSEFIKISTTEMNENFPAWLKTVGLQLTKKIRAGDELIRSKGIRKKNLESIKPLAIEEQTRCFKLVDRFKSKNK